MRIIADKEDVLGTSESATLVPPGIGQLTERSLHAALKEYLARPIVYTQDAE